MIAVAYLRVYLPEERVEPLPEHRSRPTGRISLSDYGLWEEPLADDAFAAVWRGRRFVCPRYPRLRMLEGLLAFHNAYPDMVATTLVPEAVVRRAADELQRLYDERPGARSHILTSAWHVPLRWFAAFEPSQREVIDTRGGSSIRYRTMRRSASRRLDHAVSVLDQAGFDDSVVDPVRHLTHWLNEFPPDAMVELDYGSVAGLFSDGDLALDETAADVAASIDALASGDFDEAGDYYSSAALRWSGAQARLYAN